MFITNPETLVSFQTFLVSFSRRFFFPFTKSVLLILQEHDRCRHTPTEPDIQTEKFRACFFCFVCLRFCLGVIKQTPDINSAGGSVGLEGRRGTVFQNSSTQTTCVWCWGVRHQRLITAISDTPHMYDLATSRPCLGSI